MSLRLTLVLTAVLAASASACASTPSATSPGQSPAASAPSSAEDTSAVCDGVHDFAMAKADKNDPMVVAAYEILGEDVNGLTDRQLAILQAYYAKQEKAVRPLASQATDPALRAALQTYADGWAELAATPGPDGPDRTQPDWQPVMDLCPDALERIYADLEARGQ
jgi:hypothetical protein